MKTSLIPATVLENLEDVNHVFLASTYGGLKLSESHDNFEVLCKEKVVGVEEGVFVPEEWEGLSIGNKTRLAEVLSLDNLGRWDFNILDVVEYGDVSLVLVLVGWAIIASPASQKVMAASLGREFDEKEWEGYNFASSLGIDYKTLVCFLRSLEAQYSTTQKYHNNVHAADVLQTLHSMMRMGAAELSGLATIDIYSMLLAAAAHDVGHPGTNNLYQINAQTNLAIVYNDKSPLENMHCSKASKLMKSMGLLDNFSGEQRSLVRSRMIDAILATDMTHHFSAVESISQHIEFICQFEDDGVTWHDFVQTEDSSDTITDIMNYMIHLADISNPAKTLPLAIYWAEGALAEFFFQGDLERSSNLPISPLCDRENTNLATSQRDFIRYVVLPSFEVLGKIIPGVVDEVLPMIKKNLAYWESLCQRNTV